MAGGTFIMEGGEISGNKTPTSGGGVVLIDGTFTMRGGEISGNKTTISGGGVAVAGGTFTMEGGKITGTNIAQGGGGGVVVVSGALTIKDGVFSIASAVQDTDGELVSGNFIMRGGEISGNKTTMSGGGVAIDVMTGGKFIKSGGTIDAANSARIGIVGYVSLSGTIYQKRDSAAGPDVNLDSDKPGGAGGWE
jgi:hypothetical protein